MRNGNDHKRFFLLLIKYKAQANRIPRDTLTAGKAGNRQLTYLNYI
jgi:hypothetical protein